MNRTLTIAALLSSLIAVGCGGSGGRNSDNPENSSQSQAQGQVAAPATGGEALSPQTPNQTSAAADSLAATAAQRANPQAAAPVAGVVPTPRPQPSQNQTTAFNNDAPAAAAPPAPRVPQFREVTIPAGTALALEMTTALSSATTKVESPVSARLRSPLAVNGETVIPEGTVVTGTVTDVERAGRVQGRAHLAIRFSEVRLKSGREDVQTDPVTFTAEATKSEDATKVGVGAVGGAILGGILGGKDGAGKGAIAGGAAGTGVVLATRGKEVTVGEGTAATATLAEPLTLRVPLRER